MFLKGLHGYCIRNSFYKKRDPLFIVYIAVKHHLKNYTKKTLKKVIIYVRTSYPVENFPQSHLRQSLSCLPTLLSLSSEGSFLCGKTEKKKTSTTCQNLPFHLPVRTFYPRHQHPRSHTWVYLGSHTQHTSHPHTP